MEPKSLPFLTGHKAWVFFFFIFVLFMLKLDGFLCVHLIIYMYTCVCVCHMMVWFKVQYNVKELTIWERISMNVFNWSLDLPCTYPKKRSCTYIIFADFCKFLKRNWVKWYLDSMITWFHSLLRVYYFVGETSLGSIDQILGIWFRVVWTEWNQHLFEDTENHWII